MDAGLALLGMHWYKPEEEKIIVLIFTKAHVHAPFHVHTQKQQQFFYL